jgi:hypothetical protein
MTALESAARQGGRVGDSGLVTLSISVATDRDVPHRYRGRLSAESPPDTFLCGPPRNGCAELNRRTNRFARRLMKRGATPNSRARISVQHSLDRHVATRAELKSGATDVASEASLCPERLEFNLPAAEPTIVITSTGLSHRKLLCGVPRADAFRRPSPVRLRAVHTQFVRCRAGRAPAALLVPLRTCHQHAIKLPASGSRSSRGTRICRGLDSRSG